MSDHNFTHTHDTFDPQCHETGNHYRCSNCGIYKLVMLRPIDYRLSYYGSGYVFSKELVEHATAYRSDTDYYNDLPDCNEMIIKGVIE